jgi:hypothetical protein
MAEERERERDRDRAGNGAGNVMRREKGILEDQWLVVSL